MTKKKVCRLYFAFIFLYLFFRDKIKRLNNSLFPKATLTCKNTNEQVNVSHLGDVIFINVTNRSGGLKKEWDRLPFTPANSLTNSQENTSNESKSISKNSEASTKEEIPDQKDSSQAAKRVFKRQEMDG